LVGGRARNPAGRRAARSAASGLEHGAVFVTIEADASSALRAIAAAKSAARKYAQEVNATLQRSGLKGGVDISKFLRGMNRLAAIYGDESLQAKQNILAFKIIREAVKVPIPRDTGALMHSGFVRNSPRGNQVLAGFNTAYAAYQDLGTRKMPPKFYGSPKGPNYYLSETAARFGLEVSKGLAALIAKDLGIANSMSAGGGI
jgi:hypothetical protein